MKNDIILYYEGVLAGMESIYQSKSKLDFEILAAQAKKLTIKYFYHYPIYQQVLEEWIKENK